MTSQSMRATIWSRGGCAYSELSEKIMYALYPFFLAYPLWYPQVLSEWSSFTKVTQLNLLSHNLTTTGQKVLF